MRFKTWLNEMPLNHFGYERHRNFNNANKGNTLAPLINRRDHNLLTAKKNGRPYVEDKLRDVLERLKRFNINVIILEPREGGVGRNPPDEVMYWPQVEEYIKRNNVTIEGHITFVKPGSTGDPLTAWTILHTFGHALLGQGESPEAAGIKKVMLGLWAAHNEPYDYYDRDYTPGDDQLRNFGARLFRFLSARATFCPHLRKAEKHVQDWDELVYELVAEYLWHGGRIRVQPDSVLGVVTTGTDRTKPNDLDEFPIDGKKIGLDKAVQAIESYIRQALEKNVGKVVMDYFFT